MIADGGRSVRAYRPSRLNLNGENERDMEAVRRKEANLEFYAKRVENGQPLFESGSSGNNLNLA